MTSPASHPTKRIVVGVDGSSSSIAAAEWASRQAELTQSTLHAITTWHSPTSFGYPVPILEGFDPAAEATKVLNEAIAPLRNEHPNVEIHTSVTEGYTAQILVEASAGADLLVVGSRGHGEFAGMLLGSVSEHCVTHAHCPVLVYRH
ncbi:MAG: universal stress protein [Actinomycetota bacterium]|nr:universal stress protein [Actinomycetota bacterium]